jgi:hypothetical protein
VTTVTGFFFPLTPAVNLPIRCIKYALLADLCASKTIVVGKLTKGETKFIRSFLLFEPISFLSQLIEIH